MNKVRTTGTVVALFFIACASHGAAMSRIDKSEETHSVVLMPAPSSLKLISLGYDNLVADCLWLQFIQYIGSRDSSSKNASGTAAGMLDAITSLDPQFAQAYFFIATIVGGEQDNPAYADRLLQRGIHANPDNWYIPFIAGVNEYLYAHDESRAAKYYRIASGFPSAPNWLRRQVEILEANIPSTIKRINVWQKILETSREFAVKQKARQELCSLWVYVRDHAPTSSLVRKRAAAELEALGVNIFRAEN